MTITKRCKSWAHSIPCVCHARLWFLLTWKAHNDECTYCGCGQIYRVSTEHNAQPSLNQEAKKWAMSVAKENRAIRTNLKHLQLLQEKGATNGTGTLGKVSGSRPSTHLQPHKCFWSTVYCILFVILYIERKWQWYCDNFLGPLWPLGPCWPLGLLRYFYYMVQFGICLSVCPSINVGTFCNEKSRWLQLWFIDMFGESPGLIFYFGHCDLYSLIYSPKFTSLFHYVFMCVFYCTDHVESHVWRTPQWYQFYIYTHVQ